MLASRAANTDTLEVTTPSDQEIRLTRLFDAHIICAESTFRDVEPLVRHRELGSPKLKGLKDRETLYEILGLREPASTALAPLA